MGNPYTGEIYELPEGLLPERGHASLTPTEADRLRLLDVEDRKRELKEMVEQQEKRMSAQSQQEVQMSAKGRALDMLRYHAPTQETVPKYEKVNEAFQALADTLWDLTPDGPGKTYAFRKIQDARMAVNACIANGGQ